MDLLHAALNGDKAALGKLLESLRIARHYLKGYPQIADGDYLQPAIVQIEGMVNDGLFKGVNLTLGRDHRSGEMKLQLVPMDLLACMWVQLAKSISENRKHRKCQGCDLWFEIGGQGGRPDKRYCSDACRMRINRETQEKTKISKKKR